MKKILFLHGFTSGGSCEIARTLKDELADVAEVTSPDLPLQPYDAMAMVQDMCDATSFDLIVGSSCGAFYGQQLVRYTGAPAVLISPFFKMTEFLRPRLGWHEYKTQRADGVQLFEITPELIESFGRMENEQFHCYDAYNRSRVIGMFGDFDTIAHFKDIFDLYYERAVEYSGPHTMTADNVRGDLVPVVRRMLEEFNPKNERFFCHFKGNYYKLMHAAKDSETQQRMVVYQALYGSRGYWIRPESMFFERVERDGLVFPRFAEVDACDVS